VLALCIVTPMGASYRTVHRFFHTKIDWFALQGSFFEKFCWDPKGVYLLAGDESVITKSGKCTFGLDHLFSSLFDKADRYIRCHARRRLCAVLLLLLPVCWALLAADFTARLRGRMATQQADRNDKRQHQERQQS
jgi:hypothetical protein